MDPEFIRECSSLEILQMIQKKFVINLYDVTACTLSLEGMKPHIKENNTLFSSEYEGILQHIDNCISIINQKTQETQDIMTILQGKKEFKENISKDESLNETFFNCICRRFFKGKIIPMSCGVTSIKTSV